MLHSLFVMGLSGGSSLFFGVAVMNGCRRSSDNGSLLTSFFFLVLVGLFA